MKLRRKLFYAGIYGVLSLFGSAPAFAEPSVPKESDAPIEKLTFDQAIDKALSRNPSALEAAAEIRRYDALIEQVRAASLPTLTGAAVYTRLDADRVAGNLVLAPDSGFNLAATATVPLVNVRSWATWRESRDRLDVATWNAKDVQRRIAIATARAYLAVVTQKRLVAIAAIAEDTARSHHEFTRIQLQGGVGTQLDEARAAQEVTTATTILHNQRIALTKAREALGVLVATEGGVDGDDWTFGPMPSLSTALDEAVAQRTDIRTRERAQSAAERRVHDAYSDYLPSLSAVGTAFYQTPGTATVPTTGWQAQLVLGVPIYDGGLRYGQEKERAALRDEAKLEVEQIVRQARSEVRAAISEVDDADIALTQARESAATAAKALRLATAAYKGGVTTNLEVIDAERQAREADVQAAIAEDNARQARLDVLAASGRFPVPRDLK